MLFWFITIAITAIACAALFYAAGPRVVNAGTSELDDANSHFRQVLSGIDADQASGKLGEAEALAAKGELAREVLRLKAEAGKTIRPTKELGRGPLLAGLVVVAAGAIGLYAILGSPAMDSQPLAGRAEVAAQPLDLDAAITKIEEALKANPDDERGWSVIAPVYMQLSRFDDAANAYRRVIELDGATPDLLTSLAEALMMGANGAGSVEAVDLLRAASAADPTHVLSRLYLAAELTRRADYPAAVDAWNDAIALAKGDESWLPAARQGLAVAQNGGIAPVDGQEAEMISRMVSGLATRLNEQGGTIEEWTQLVRAYLVVGDAASAQTAYDGAIAAYPQAFDRGDLDTLALGAGLKLNGVTP